MDVVEGRIANCAKTRGSILCLDGKGLTSLPKDLRNDMPYLRDLYLYSNRISSLNSKTLQCLSRLRNLSLYNNQLTSIPPAIGFLTALQELQLEGNYISSLPAQIGLLSSLLSLVLSNNKLRELPPEIGLLTNLRRLILYRNDLASLPSSIKTLVSLKVLNVGHNRLTRLIPEVGLLTSLQQLELSENEDLRSLPLTFFNLTSLVNLYIPPSCFILQGDKQPSLLYNRQPNSLLDICLQTLHKNNDDNTLNTNNSNNNSVNSFTALWETISNSLNNSSTNQGSEIEPFRGFKRLPEELKERYRKGLRKCVGCGGFFFGRAGRYGIQAIGAPKEGGGTFLRLLGTKRLLIEVQYCNSSCIHKAALLQPLNSNRQVGSGMFESLVKGFIG